MSAIYFKTKNLHKIKEYKQILNKHNVKVLDDLHDKSNSKCLATVRETSSLYSKSKEIDFEQWLLTKIPI